MTSRLFNYVIAVFFLTFPVIAIGDTGCRLTAGWEQDPPFHYKDQNGNLVGSDTEILTKAMKKIGCQLDFRDQPWSRTLRDVEKRQS